MQKLKLNKTILKLKSQFFGTSVFGIFFFFFDRTKFNFIGKPIFLFFSLTVGKISFLFELH
jgi:hypothetical protein